MNRRPKSSIASLFILALMALMATGLIYWGTGLPVVQVHHLTRECLAVVPATAGTCSALPDDFVVEFITDRDAL